VNHAIEALVAIIASAPADANTRAGWLERLWEAQKADTLSEQLRAAVSLHSRPELRREGVLWFETMKLPAARGRAGLFAPSLLLVLDLGRVEAQEPPKLVLTSDQVIQGLNCTLSWYQGVREAAG
jgi:hypothetical protein